MDQNRSRSSSLRQANSAQQVRVARVGTETVEPWVDLYEDKPRPIGKALFQSRECSILLVKIGIITSRTLVVSLSFKIFGVFPEITGVTRFFKDPHYLFCAFLMMLQPFKFRPLPHCPRVVPDS